MIFTQKYTIVQLFERMPEGASFVASEWPLHVTLADVFATSWSEASLVAHLNAIAPTLRPCNEKVIGEDWFGPDKSVPVMLLSMGHGLQTLHESLLTMLSAGRAVFNAPHYTRSGFRAHSTVRLTKQLHIGDTVDFTSLTLIDMFPNHDPYVRRVVQTVRLG